MSSPDLVTLEEIDDALSVIARSGLVRRTPLAAGFDLPAADSGLRGTQLFLKLENMQNTGSFKLRGMVNVFGCVDAASKGRGAVTMSAGNAGKSFATLARAEGVNAVVVMPTGVPDCRKAEMRALGSHVELAPLDQLQDVVNRRVQDEGRFYCHPFDSRELIAGHASCGVEILEDCPDADVVLVCCGGGGLVSGVASAVRLRGSSARVYAVEPEGAPSMSMSLEAGRARALEPGQGDTIAHGLAAPFAGPVSFEHVRARTDGVLLVSDAELRRATRMLYSWGILAEVSGAAGLAALLSGKVPDAEGKKVVCVVSGANIKPDELVEEVFDGAGDAGSAPAGCALTVTHAGALGFALGLLCFAAVRACRR